MTQATKPGRLPGNPAPPPPDGLGGLERQRAWVEVDAAAIETNARALRRHLRTSELMAVVKADGYGHGALTVARSALAGGAASLGVATLAEGIELRRSGIEAPVLVLGGLSHEQDLRSCLHWRLMPTVSRLQDALLCQNLASGQGRPMALQLKLDTGMARLGVDWEQGPRLVAAIAQLDAVRLAGVYSHLASADLPPGEDGGLTRQQQQRFEAVLTSLRQQGLDPGCRHLANSAGALSTPGLHYDLARVGLALYGHLPAAHLGGVVALQPAMALRARVTLIRELAAGVGVSYGHRFRTRRPSRLAVLAIGYADGVPRALSNQLEVLVRGQRLPQVGAITMDQLIVDATDCPALEVGAVVTLLGRDGDREITPQEWSDRCGTIPWEILCGFKHRLPRLGGGGSAAR